MSPQVPAVPEGRPAAADLPSQLLHAGGAARRAPARGHRAVPRLHGVSAGTAAALLGREGKGILHREELAEGGMGTDLMPGSSPLVLVRLSLPRDGLGKKEVLVNLVQSKQGGVQLFFRTLSR